MFRTTWMVLPSLAIALLISSSASAGGPSVYGLFKHKKLDKQACVDKPLDCGPTCYIWQAQEITETIYELKPKKIKKTICKTVIEEVSEPVSCKVCKPIPRDALRQCPQPGWAHDLKEIDIEVHKPIEPACPAPCAPACEPGCDPIAPCGHHGHKGLDCVTPACPTPACEPCMQTTMEKAPVTCLRRTNGAMVKGLEYIGVPVEEKYEKKHLVPKVVKEEIELEVFELVPRQITRTVWRKVPYYEPCEPTCEPCTTCEPEPVCEPACPASAPCAPCGK